MPVEEVEWLRVMMEKDDLTLLFIAQNARMRIAARLTTKHKAGVSDKT